MGRSRSAGAAGIFSDERAAHDKSAGERGRNINRSDSAVPSYVFERATGAGQKRRYYTSEARQSAASALDKRNKSDERECERRDECNDKRKQFRGRRECKNRRSVSNKRECGERQHDNSRDWRARSRRSRCRSDELRMVNLPRLPMDILMSANAVVPSHGHVFILVEENHSYSSVIGSSAMPYLNSLASRYGLATNYFANTQPSIGDYFWLTTGQVITNDSNFTGTVSADNIVRQLVAAGKTWKSYAESLPSVGYTGTDQYPYVKRHNPFAYFTDVINSPAQTSKLVPFSQLATDLSNNQLPNYSFIIPNQFNNAHDCPPNQPSCTDADKLAAADNWLSTNIAPLIASPVFQQDGLLVIVFDESFDSDTAGGGGHVPAIVISPRVKPGYRSTTFYQHQSVLRMTAEALGLTSFPGAGSTAPNMLEFFDTSTSPAPAVSAVSPNSGTTNGGTSVTISGSGFSTGATVMIGGLPATNINVTNSASITATTPAHAAGAVDVAVTNTNGLRSTLNGGYTYTSTPPTETVLLADDFNDNSLNTTKWTASNLFSGFTDPGLPTLETNQRLEIGPMLVQTSGSHYNGLRAATSYNFTNAYCYVELVQAPASNTTADAMLTIGRDVDNYYRIFVESGTLVLQKKIGAAKATLLTASYSAVNHRYWRIRHDQGNNRVVFEVAADNGGVPGSWTQLYNEAWSTSGIPLGRCRWS